MTLRSDLLQDFRVVHCMLADRKEHRLGAFVRERFQHRRRVDGPGTIIEGQHHFLVLQEVVLLKMFEAETRSAGCVDLDNASNAERRTVRAVCWPWRRDLRPRCACE